VIAKSILITGGSGSFGKAFVRRLLQGNLAERVCVLSRGEHRQAEMREELGNDERLRFFVGDVRDAQRLKRAMTGVDVVVHAAALKRVDVAQMNPVELCRTNVDGSINVVEASQDAGVKKVVGLSSDKATSPIGGYGASKALMECLFLAANNTVPANGPRYAITRYGNVWNSASSVVPTWRRMIEAGSKAVPVTSPEATRFWMSLDQAVDLVLRTIETMRGGELVIPDLPAYRLGDLAEAMGVRMVVHGLPAHEKLHEEMRHGEPSDNARRMSVAELREKLAEIGFRPNVREAA
jgi:UDP-N-acetylglucosamine 4,6-dehydratase